MTRRIINEKGRADEIQPAARLVIAVLTLAARDYWSGDSSAAVFIASPSFDSWCTLIGANPSYLRRRIEREMPPQGKGVGA
jgi:hypothetical protein